MNCCLISLLDMISLAKFVIKWVIACKQRYRNLINYNLHASTHLTVAPKIFISKAISQVFPFLSTGWMYRVVNANGTRSYCRRCQQCWQISQRRNFLIYENVFEHPTPITYTMWITTKDSVRENDRALLTHVAKYITK